MKWIKNVCTTVVVAFTSHKRTSIMKRNEILFCVCVCVCYGRFVVCFVQNFALTVWSNTHISTTMIKSSSLCRQFPILTGEVTSGERISFFPNSIMLNFYMQVLDFHSIYATCSSNGLTPCILLSVQIHSLPVSHAKLATWKSTSVLPIFLY